ncbi:gamma-type small acid-soluble spore protein [Thermoflavimicrobium dichotomicum]|uniref:Small, acid-soluble spore protein gamma-type n=1 Tax=Thermoflavimicrobium dichotomicum TaxID=46223 RepID=A0A1I3MTD5_9BACL|nr:gamma-type small acid-soluble spore protein [Thermoflavimicrobium dichotomicum]SFI99995.1 small acid-soluble spore protein E (minor gamma-type SASP) [Thermoflavimicrobium dichotomicum]
MDKFKNQAKQAAGTNAQQVRQQNQRSAQSAGGYQSYETEFAAAPGSQQAARGAQATPQANAANQNFATEFASETNAQRVRAQNQQSMANKNKNQQ